MIGWLGAQVPSFLTYAAGMVTATTVIAVGVGAMSRTRPVRWLWRRNVSEPLARWGARFVATGADTVVRAWHREHVAPELERLQDGVERATAWGEVLAAREGIPPTTDPRELLRQMRANGH